MPHSSPRSAALAALSAAALVAAVGVGAAAPASAAPPGLSVTISNDADEVSSDSAVGYRAAVENAGAEAVELRLVLTVPGFAQIADVAGAVVDGGTASWPVTVEPGAVAAADIVVEIGEIPADALWVSAQLEVFEPGSDIALIAAADVDPVAGAEGARAQAALDTERALAHQSQAEGGQQNGWPGGAPSPLDLMLAGGALAAVALFLASLLLRRRARRLAAAQAVVQTPLDVPEATRRNRKR